MNPSLNRLDYKIIEDQEYGYLRVDPIPSQEDVDRFYREEFFTKSYRAFNDSALEVQQEERQFFESRWQRIYDFIRDHFGKVDGISLFDIGFGYGQALEFFKNKGLNVSGIEPIKEGYEFARSKGLDVILGGIEEFDLLEGRRYDSVILLNVLEHLRNPAETLIKIREKALEKDGILVIDVPNEFNSFQTVANEEYNLQEWWVCPPVHINYFSASSLHKLLTLSGFRVLEMEASFPLELFILFGDVYVGNSELGKKCHEKRVKFEFLMKKHGNEKELISFYKSLANLNLGRQVVAFAVPEW